MINCKAPNSGITITPWGDIRPCCAYDGSLGNINDIDDISEHFRSGEQYKALRGHMATKDIQDYKPCASCVDGKQEMKAYENFSPEVELEYLEVTASNICNQSCIMCSPMFSTTLGTVLGNKTFNRLTAKQILDILKNIPNLKAIQLKGGEPFADMKNAIILERIAKVNPDCKVTIQTNTRAITPAWYPILSRLNNLSLGVSIDATGELYEWIRGTDFDTTHNTLQDVRDMLPNAKLNCTVTTSVFNFWEHEAIYDQVSDHVDSFDLSNVLRTPEHLSILMLDQVTLTKRILELATFAKATDKCTGIESFYNSFTLDNPDYEKLRAHINQFNKIRKVNYESPVSSFKY